MDFSNLSSAVPLLVDTPPSLVLRFTASPSGTSTVSRLVLFTDQPDVANLPSDAVSLVKGTSVEIKLQIMGRACENEPSDAEYSTQQPENSQGKKRKADEDEFSPVDAGQDSGDEQLVKKVRRQGEYATKYYSNVQQDKPEPCGQPQVWADKRQQLCQVLDYYNAYQSGAYTSKNIVYGFLIDKETTALDFFGDEVIIARVGGGRKADANGNMKQTKNQETSKLADAFRNSKRNKVPIAVIAGQGNPLFPSRLPHYYNVLGWFHAIDFRCLEVDGVKTQMVRLEKIYLDERSWWSPRTSSTRLSTPDNSTPTMTCRVCQTCGEESDEIFKEGWTCLIPSCDAWFSFNVDVDKEKLKYNDAYLQARTKWTGKTPGPLAPKLPTEENLVAEGAFGVEETYRRGIVCPNCGCCSRRVEWHQWSCENQDCEFIHRVSQRIMPIAAAVLPILKAPTEIADRSINIRHMEMGLYNVTEYTMPNMNGEIIGSVWLFTAIEQINQQPDGPDDLFMQMQEGDFGLRRNAARLKNTPSEMLTAHYAANWGAPYKYGVAQISKGFDKARPVILKALKRLTWAGQQATTDGLEEFQPFNELLSVGYFEKGHMGYHDDGEKELGPTIASLSLGGPAQMSFRPKAKSSIGAPSKNARGTKRDVLRFNLHHGDMVVMSGRGIQKYYEHSVKSLGRLRFALTSRFVDPEMMASDEDREHTAAKGALPAGSEMYNYDGF